MNEKDIKNNREPHYPVKHRHLWEYWVDSSSDTQTKPLTLSTEFLSSENRKLHNEIIINATKNGSRSAYQQIRALLKDVSIEQSILDKALVLATKHNHNEIAELLLDNKANPEAYNGKAYLEAAAKNNLRLLCQYADKKPDLNKLNLKAMAIAAKHGHLETIEHFVDNGDYAYKDNGKAYQEAYSHGQKHIVSYFEKQGLTVGYLNSQSIKKAAQNGSLVKFAQDNPVKFRADFVVIHKLASKQTREAIYKAFVEHKYKDKTRPLGIWTSYNGILLDLDFAAMNQHFSKRLEKKYGTHNKP